MENKKTYINEDGSMDFDKFNLLSENEQKNEMAHWTEKQWFDYDNHTPALTEEEVFGPVLEIIYKDCRDCKGYNDCRDCEDYNDCRNCED